MTGSSGAPDSPSSSRAADLESARDVLRTYWGHPEFRPGQEASIGAVLDGRDVLTILPTGGGKSVCYQVPAVLGSGVTLVVCPLIALMQDQVASLRARGIPAAYLSSELSHREIDQRLTNAEFGQYDLLYLAPERLESDLFQARLDRLTVDLIAVDEAHCVSEWGHDFRPAYLTISEIREPLDDVPVIACTATATPEVRSDVVEQLELRDPKRVVTGFDRPNLRWSVLYPDDRYAAADRVAERVDGSGILYGSTRRQVDRAAGRREDTEAYHAGLDGSEREGVQREWSDGECRLVAATNAFGMGVDKSDVRQVTHLMMPASVEAYYQEAGRAGRDGDPAHAVLVYREGDEEMRERIIASSHPDRTEVLEVYRTVGELAQVPLGSEPEEPVPVPLGRIAELADVSVPLVRTAVELLEREEVWRRVRPRPHHGLLRFRQPVESIRSFAAGLENRALAEFVRTMLRTIYADAASRWYELDVRLLARRSGLPRERVSRGLSYLSEHGLVAWHPPDRSTVRVIYLQPRSRSIPLDLEPIDRAGKRSRRNLDYLLRYVWVVGCRRRYLLGYFGQEAEERCGRCDYCLGRHRPDELDERDRGVARSILARVDERGVIAHWKEGGGEARPDEDRAGTEGRNRGRVGAEPDDRYARFRVLTYLADEGYLEVVDSVAQRFALTGKGRSFLGAAGPGADR